MKIQPKSGVGKYIWTALTLTVIVGIFLFSCQNSEVSNNTSGSFRAFLQRILGTVWPGSIAALDFFWRYIRKFAHFTVYLILGICTNRTANAYLTGKRRTLALVSLVFCAFYAGTDEFHQLFVPGRAGMLQDVLLDSAGACLGIFLTEGTVSLFGWWKRRSQRLF